MVAASSFAFIFALTVFPTGTARAQYVESKQRRKLGTLGNDNSRRRTKKSSQSHGKGGEKTSERGKGRSQKSSKKYQGKGSGGKRRHGDFCSSFTFPTFNDSDIMANIFSGVAWNGNGKDRRNLQIADQGRGCSQNGLEVMRGEPNLSIFVDLLEFAGLDEIFSCAGPFTILAPSNVAFNENPDLLRSLFNPRNLEVVEDMLEYHIVRSLFLSKDLVEGPLQTLSNDEINVRLNPVRFNQAGVMKVDILACNSAIHIIDDMLIPPGTPKEPISTTSHSILASPILPKVCEILDFRQPGQFPNSPWFRTHFLRESGSKRRNLQFRGERCRNDIFDIVRADPNLSIFSELLRAADLDDIFHCAGPFTVLAPENAAFLELDTDVQQQLLDPRMKEKLQEILLYHILPKYQPTTSFTSSGPLETLLTGVNASVAIDPLRFDSSQVVGPDNEACNGVVHSIAGVLMPQDIGFCDEFKFVDNRMLQAMGSNCSGILDIARNNPELSIALSLIEAAGIDPIFGCEGPFTVLIPSNDAFNNLDMNSFSFLADPTNMSYLRNLLLYHILPGISLSSSFTPGPTDTLLSDVKVMVQVEPLRFDNAIVIESDIDACQGIAHVLDNVLVPFMIPTPSPTPNGDCAAYTFNRRTRQLQNQGRDCDRNILDVARQNSDLTIFTTLIDVARLTTVFSCAGPFTGIFPSNTAFDDVPTAFLDDLLLPQNVDRLQEFLLYHIIPGAMLSSQFTAGPQDTLADAQIDVTLDPLEFNGFDLFSADIQACNGYVNVVSGLLNPFDNITPGPTSPTNPQTPTSVPVERLVVRDFYISFVSNGAREPNASEYNEMVQRTADYFGRVLRDFYSSIDATEFLGAEAVLDGTLFGAEAGIPEERFNIYMDFSFSELTFSADSVIPTSMELFDLMSDSISPTYITDVVRTFTGSPFESTTEAFFSASETNFP